MTTEAQFLREHQRTYRAFIKGAVWSGIAVIVTLALLALFRT